MIRDIRRSDATRLFDLMDREFPEESALLGNRPEGLQKVLRRVFRWDTRFIIGLLRLFGKPIFRALIVEADGVVVATTMVTFPPVSSFVSNVVVDPAYRRRGYARRMLEEARQTARRARRKYIALDVLDTNTRARALYDSIGYRPLRSRTQFVLDSAVQFGPTPPSNAMIRPFRKTDAHAIAQIVRRQTPPAVEAVLPVSERVFAVSRMETRMLASEAASWVIDRGHGPEGHVGASVSEVFTAGHITAPVLSESVDADLADALVRTAGAWCAARQAPRILSMVADDNVRGRETLERAGFRHAFALWTLYRPVD